MVELGKDLPTNVFQFVYVAVIGVLGDIDVWHLAQVFIDPIDRARDVVKHPSPKECGNTKNAIDKDLRFHDFKM